VPLESQSQTGVNSLATHGSPLSGFPIYPGKHSLHSSPVVWFWQFYKFRINKLQTVIVLTYFLQLGKNLLTIQVPVSGSQWFEWPLQVHGSHIPKYKPIPSCLVYPTAQSSHDRPTYPSGHEHSSTSTALFWPVLDKSATSSETDCILWLY
jgi:hypothetical protein